MGSVLSRRNQTTAHYNFFFSDFSSIFFFWVFHFCLKNSNILFLFLFFYELKTIKNFIETCVGRFCPVFQLCVRKGPAQYPVWGETNIRGHPAEEWTKLPSEERWSMFVRNWLCPRTMVTSVLLSEVPGELVNHSEQCLEQIL